MTRQNGYATSCRTLLARQVFSARKRNLTSKGLDSALETRPSYLSRQGIRYSGLSR
jgi:hypothetical protein